MFKRTRTEDNWELATLYDVIVLEDLAYFAMDFRKNLGNPFRLHSKPQ